MRIPVDISNLREPHKGLLLDKFLYAGVDSAGKTILPDWAAVPRYASDTALYQAAYARWRALWTAHAETTVLRQAAVTGRLAIGLGAGTVLENGVRLHHTYGTPLIPGSSLRGALRAAVPDPGERDFLFGPENSSEAGFARVHDAWWIPQPNRSGLDVDVAAVHHHNYYEGKGAPTDYDDPRPIRFLTVSGSFLFVIEAPNKAWKEWLENLLKAVLTRRGIGAKRSAGYGRFKF